jgi:hypothetical protein
MAKMQAPEHLEWALAYPIKLRGRAPPLVTVRDAVEFLSALPQQRLTVPFWTRTVKLLARAQETGDKLDLRDATDQLARALIADGYRS